MAVLVREPAREIGVLTEADVVVAGAGVAGFSAAMAAAAAGARTVLLERNGFLGGVAGPALMTSMTNFIMTGDNRQVVKGICEQVLDRLAACGATTDQWRTRELPQIVFDQESFRRILAEMLYEANVEVLVETWLAAPLMEGDTLKGVIVESKSGRQAILAHAVVDATGDADLAAWVGAPFRNAPPDSGSLLFFMRDADLDETARYFEENPQEWQQYSDMVTTLDEFLRNWRERGVFHLPHGGARKMTLVREAVESGDYSREYGQYCKDLDIFGLFARRGTNEVLINSCNFRIDHLDARTHAAAEMEARRAVPYIAGFLQRHMPGFKNAKVSQTATMIGVRFTRWIDAGFDLKRQDLIDGTRFDDVVGTISASAHHPKGGTIFLPNWVDLPYRIMIPQKVENLLVASGKSVSTDIRGIVRGQVPCYVLGQAAGAAAAVAARNGTTVRDVDVKQVQSVLLKQGVHLGDESRLRELGLS